MKRYLFAAAVAMLISTTAVSAFELNCGAPRVALGDEPGDNNPVVSVDIRYIPEDHAWRIFHNRRDGLVVSRSEQYAIQDASNDRRAQWQGSLNRARHLYMIGEVRRVEKRIVYMEWMYDRKKNNALVMQSTALCTMAAPPLPQPTTQAPTPPRERTGETTISPRPAAPVTARVKDSVPIYPHNGSLTKIDVLMGGQPLRMLLDTGADLCLITEAIATRLLNDGHAEWQQNGRVLLADGTIRSLPVVLIREVRIGRHVIRNVRAGVSSTDQIILAFPVVNSIAPFTIDTRAGELIFHTAAS
jgi:Aspartyl protease